MSVERARLFVALELPSVARSTLAHWSSLALDEVGHGRPLGPESLHATLCFLGWRTVDEVPAIARACRAVASRRRVVLALGPTRWLPEHQPRVLAVELVDSDEGLTQLHAALSRKLHSGGWYEPEQRPFLAHVTVARFSKGTPVAQPELICPTPLRFIGDAVTLYRSYTDPGGARYQPLETVGLSG
ncbi:MAG: RNA 2',3'-cyclic phosphodiesterase [Solirubrobacteraceae bacterium]